MPLERYGLVWDKYLSERKLPRDQWNLAIEQWCFLNSHPIEKKGLGRFGHFKAAADIIWPAIKWNAWLEEQIHSLTDPEYTWTAGNTRIWNVSWAGCAGSGKTYTASLFALNWFLASPGESIAILCSTTKAMVKRRTWTEIKRLWLSSGHESVSGHLVPNNTSIYALDPSDPQNLDERHTVHCIAVKRGELEAAIADIQGQHARRILIIIDEAPETPEAIYETIPNLRKGCQELIVLSIGNPVSKRLDAHGKVSEPQTGWQTVDRFTHRWRTKANKRFQLPSGQCIHFPGRESPNVKAGKTIHPFLYTLEDHQNALELKGEKDLGYWKYDEAFWTPEGVANTVFNETLIQTHRGTETLKFIRIINPASGVDPGFGGDACIQTFATLGELENHRIGIQLNEWTEIGFSIGKTKEMQIREQAQRNCEGRGILPQHLGLDCTGIGRGAYSYLYDQWSNKVVAVEFGGAPSEMPASNADRRPGTEVYDRRVTELWFTILEFLKGGQLGGMYPELILELCTREYCYKTGKLSVIKKEDMFSKLGYSPNHADALAVLVQVARNMGAQPEGSGSQRSRDHNWLDTAIRLGRVYETESEEHTVNA